MRTLRFDDQEGEKKMTYICPDCKSEEYEIRNGEVYCLKCGLVLE